MDCLTASGGPSYSSIELGATWAMALMWHTFVPIQGAQRLDAAFISEQNIILYF